jgi:predicted trehalose synthase
LTCDFWAENAERKIKAKAKAIKSVASAFGFAPAIGRAVAALRLAVRGAESPALIPKAENKTTAGQLRDDNKKSKGNGVDWRTVEVEKRISPLRCSQRREQLRSK